ncbi:MAG: hypothetical protein AAFY54_09905 [Cyanobacteria bacterium J06648_10]
MTFAIEITPELEHKIENAAKEAGLSPSDYVLQIISETVLPQTRPSLVDKQLSKEETALVQTINNSLSDIEWKRYYELIEKRKEETLDSEEQEVLIALSDQIEEANVNRLTAVAQLAALRRTSIDVLMEEMELTPRTHA